jgi:hypothetical protein
MTIFFPSHAITIRRLRSIGSGKSNYSATFTGYYADIQPVGPDRIDQVNGRLGQTYEAWVDATVNVKEGDQVDSGGVRYSVKAVNYFHGAGLLDHKYLLLVSQDSA